MLELTWLILAYGCGLLAQQCRLPIFVGYLLAGWVLGFSGETVTPLLEHASMLGVLFLLFTVGMHLDLQNIMTRVVWAGGGLHLLLSTLIFLITCLAFGMAWKPALYLGVLLSLSSTVIAAKNLEARNELGAAHGRAAIGILILQDLVAVSMLAVAGTTHFDPLLLLLLPAALLGRPLLRWLADRSHAPDLLLVYITALVLGFAAWFHAAGISAELGALVAGAIMAGHRRSDELSGQIWSLKELLLVAFFVKVGMLGLPSMDALYWAGLILLVLPFKAILFYCLLALLGMPRRSAFITGATLTSYSEFTLVGGLAAHSSGLLSADYVSVLALATVLSFAINLPLNRLVLTLHEKVSGWLARLETPHQQPTAERLHDPHSCRHLVVGMGRTGAAAYRMLAQRHFPVLGIDIDPIVAAKNERDGSKVLCNDARDPSLWHSHDLAHIESVVIALPQIEARVAVVRSVVAACADIRICVYALNEEEVKLLRRAGAHDVSLILDDAGARLAELAIDGR